MYRNLLLGLLAPTALLFAGANLSRIYVFDGQVVSTSGGRITLLSGGVEIEIEVESDTRITVDGEVATLDDITPDHVATVTAKQVGTEWFAIEIEARSQAAQVTPSASCPLSAAKRPN